MAHGAMKADDFVNLLGRWGTKVDYASLLPNGVMRDGQIRTLPPITLI